MTTNSIWAEAAEVTYIDTPNGTITGVPDGYTMAYEFNDMVEPGGAELGLQFAIYKADDNGELIVAFKGTEDASDMLANSDLG